MEMSLKALDSTTSSTSRATEGRGKRYDIQLTAPESIFESLYSDCMAKKNGMIQGIEWIFLFIVFVVLILLLRRSSKRRYEKKMEEFTRRALAVIRSKGGKASIDDIIVLGGIPPSALNEVMGRLLERGIIKVTYEDGRTVYALT